MACDPQTLARNAACFNCLPPGYYYPIKLAILARWLKTLNPAADTSPAGLMEDSNTSCIACPPGAQLGPIKLALVCAATGGPAPPSNFNLLAASTNGAIQMSWTQASAPTTNEIWRSQNGGAFALLASQAGALTSFTDATVYADGTLVEYKVRAVVLLAGDFTVVRGALKVRDDSFTALTTVSYPTVQVVLGSYALTFTGGVLNVQFPELLYAFNPAICVLDFSNIFNCTTLNLSKLIHAGGIITNGDALLTTLSLSALSVVDQNLSLTQTKLSSLICPALTSVGGFIDLSNIAFSGPVSMPLLQTVGTDFASASASGFTSINLSSLKTVGGALALGLTGTTPATTLSLPALTSITASLSVTNWTGLLTITANALTTITNGVCQIENNAALQTVSMNACTVVGGACLFQNCANLTTVSMSGLQNVGDITADDLSFFNLPSLTSINFSSLVHINQSLGINGTGMSTITFPALTNIGENVSIGDGGANPNLTSISLPVFASFGGNLTCNGQPTLSSFNAPVVIFTDGVLIDFTGCALTHTSIEQIVRRGVVSGVTTCDFEFTGGANAHLSQLSAQGQADVATLTGLGNIVNITP